MNIMRTDLRNASKIAALIFFLGTSIAFAQGGSVGTGGTTAPQLINPLGKNCNDLSCPLQKVIQFLWIIATPLAAIMVLVGGFQMMTSAGDPEKFSSGKKTLLYAAIGFVVLLVSGSVATVIQNLFSQ